MDRMIRIVFVIALVVGPIVVVSGCGQTAAFGRRWNATH